MQKKIKKTLTYNNGAPWVRLTGSQLQEVNKMSYLEIEGDLRWPDLD